MMIVKIRKTCMVTNCDSDNSDPVSDITFFPIPSDRGLFKKWCDNIKNNTRYPLVERASRDRPRQYICSLHFGKNDFNPTFSVKYGTRLLPRAVPTIFYNENNIFSDYSVKQEKEYLQLDDDKKENSDVKNTIGSDGILLDKNMEPVEEYLQSDDEKNENVEGLANTDIENIVSSKEILSDNVVEPIKQYFNSNEEMEGIASIKNKICFDASLNQLIVEEYHPNKKIKKLPTKNELQELLQFEIDKNDYLIKENIRLEDVITKQNEQVKKLESFLFNLNEIFDFKLPLDLLSTSITNIQQEELKIETLVQDSSNKKPLYSDNDDKNDAKDKITDFDNTSSNWNEDDYPDCENKDFKSETGNFDKSNDDYQSDSSIETLKNDDFFMVPEIKNNRSSYKKLEGNKIQCTICDKILQHKPGFYRHLEVHEEQTRLCYKCGKVFINHRKLVEHIALCKGIWVSKLGSGRRPGQSNYQHKLVYCPYKHCIKRFDLEKHEYKLKDHIDFHKGIKSYFCNNCQKPFQYLNFVYMHVNYSKGKCTLDDFALPDYAPRFGTFEEFKEYSSNDYFKHACRFCSKKFEALNYKLYDHENIHTKDRPYSCTCGSKYNAMNTMREHLKISKDCPLEGITLPNYCSIGLIASVRNPNNNRKRLKPNYHKEMKYQTSKRNLFSNEINEEIRNQIGDDKRKTRPKKRFFCIECNLEFKTGFALRVHKESTHLERKILCPESECNKKFATKGKLKLHVKDQHYKQKCGFCDKIFTLSGLRDHIRKNHFKNNENLFECNKCSKTFKDNESLQIHKKGKNHFYEKKLPVLHHCLVCDEKLYTQEFLEHFKSHQNKSIAWCDKYNIKLDCKYCTEKPMNLYKYFKHIFRVHRQYNAKKLFDDFINPKIIPG